ncbi:unnamed protein product [Soboliphyme baturini]|uniref:Transmembrane protein n=1 Tax=Soboliphyme baturini TaxID=241478 RepID=A0A183ICF0_9BILA|nr:unnamed protein product [Soboliphyme baturini]
MTVMLRLKYNFENVYSSTDAGYCGVLALIVIWGIMCRLSLKDRTGFIAKCRLLSSIFMLSVSAVLLAWAFCCCSYVFSLLPCCSRIVMRESITDFKM